LILVEVHDVDLQRFDTSNWKAPVAASQEPRSKGVHLTGIIQWLWYGSLPPDHPNRIVKERELAEELEDAEAAAYPLRMAMGVAWERWAAGLYPDMVWQPGEFERDGITGSPDGLSWDSATDEIHVPILEEFKLTWKSSRWREGEGILKDTLWMWQLTGYMAICNLTRANLHVGYVNGDYSRPYVPLYRIYRLEIETREREEMWERMFCPAARELIE
jgi:hypothetical protein